MNDMEFKSVLNLDGAKRYEYFIKRVVDNEELWGIYNDGWAMVGDDDGREGIPFWPRKEFAEASCINQWQGYDAEPIDLYEFMDKWLVDMENDKLYPAIFYTNKDKGVIVEPKRLLDDLEIELEKY